MMIRTFLAAALVAVVTAQFGLPAKHGAAMRQLADLLPKDTANHMKRLDGLTKDAECATTWENTLEDLYSDCAINIDEVDEASSTEAEWADGFAEQCSACDATLAAALVDYAKDNIGCSDAVSWMVRGAICAQPDCFATALYAANDDDGDEGDSMDLAGFCQDCLVDFMGDLYDASVVMVDGEASSCGGAGFGMTYQMYCLQADNGDFCAETIENFGDILSDADDFEAACASGVIDGCVSAVMAHVAGAAEDLVAGGCIEEEDADDMSEWVEDIPLDICTVNADGELCYSMYAHGSDDFGDVCPDWQDYAGGVACPAACATRVESFNDCCFNWIMDAMDVGADDEADFRAEIEACGHTPVSADDECLGTLSNPGEPEPEDNAGIASCTTGALGAALCGAVLAA